jgi:hypothetical protein
MTQARSHTPRLDRRDTRRRFEQWARNPDCLANTISAVHGIPMQDVARAEGLPRTMGQSPFAIVRGRGFERTLFADGAARLRGELVRCGLLPESAGGFLDLRLRQSGGTSPDLDTALEKTRELLIRAAGPGAGLPTIVAGATISVPGGGMLPEAILVVDVLLIRREEPPRELVVGEIKTYPDRGGYTDGSELATARAQAGVYVHGFEVVLESWGLRDRLDVAHEGFLVLSRPGFNLPSVRPGEDLRYQVERAHRGFQRLREVAAGVSIARDSDGIAEVRTAECSYSEGCLSFCDRASGCYERAVESSDPIVLGEDVARFLGPVSLDRACQLLSGAKPTGEAETDVARRLDELGSLLRR